jgi:hypothetical protein
VIDLEIGFLALYLLLLILVAYGWFTRAQREPGRHRYPDPPAADSHPYPYDGPLLEQLSVFPDFDPAPKRLASTGELRQYAYDGNLDAIRQDNTDWTTAA